MGILDLFRRTTASPAQVARTAPVLTKLPRKRSYSGAAQTARYSDFRSSILSADAELEVALSVLRGRARNLERNNPHIRRYIQLMQDNIVGHVGFGLQVRAKQDRGTGLDKIGNDAIEAEWLKWSKTATADGQMSAIEAARMAVRAWCRDGEVIIQFRTGSQFPLGFALKFIEADMLDETLNRVYPGTTNRIRMGVEIDADERPVAYHMLTQHPGDTWFAGNNRKYVRVPASEILHIYVKSRPGQTRGEPPMAPIMTDTKMLAGYREAEITNRRMASSKMGFFEKTLDAGDVEGIADSETEDGQLEMEVEPGKMSVLAPGYKFNAFDAAGSTTDYVGFEKQIIRSIAAGLGPSYFDLGMDLEDVSYSSIRQGALSDRDFYRGMQRFFIDRLMSPIYSRWLQYALDFGSTGLPPFRYEKFHNASKFVPRGWSWVDPEKEVSAAIKAREGRMNSLTRIIGEQGLDFEDVADEIAQEEKYLEERKIPVISKNEPPPVDKATVSSDKPVDKPKAKA